MGQEEKKNPAPPAPEQTVTITLGVLEKLIEAKAEAKAKDTVATILSGKTHDESPCGWACWPGRLTWRPARGGRLARWVAAAFHSSAPIPARSGRGAGDGAFGPGPGRGLGAPARMARPRLLVLRRARGRAGRAVPLSSRPGTPCCSGAAKWGMAAKDRVPRDAPVTPVCCGSGRGGEE